MISQSTTQPTNQPTNQSTSQSRNQSIRQASKKASTQAMDQWTNQPIALSFKQTSKQSIFLAWAVCYPFKTMWWYSNLLKILVCMRIKFFRWIEEQWALSIQQNHRFKFSEFSLVEWNAFPELEVTCSATHGMLGETLLCLKMADFLSIFAAFELDDWSNKLYHSRWQRRHNTSGCSCLLYGEGINSC